MFLGTVGPDGRPHSTGIGCIADGGHVYFTSGPKTRKSRNLAGNPACTLSFRLPGVDLTLEARRGVRPTRPSSTGSPRSTVRSAGPPSARTTR